MSNSENQFVSPAVWERIEYESTLITDSSITASLIRQRSCIILYIPQAFNTARIGVLQGN